MSEEKYTPEQLEQMADQLLAGDNAPAGADKPASQDKAANKSVLDEKTLASLPAAALVAKNEKLNKNDFNNLFSDVYDILKVNGLFLFTYQIGQGEDMVDEPYLNEKGKNSLYMCYHTDEEINDLLHSFSYTELFKKQKIEMSPSAINSNSVTTVFILAKKIK